MPDLFRYNVIWNGLPTGPGLSTWYSESATGDAGTIHTFYSSISAYLPIGISCVFPAVGDILDAGTGVVHGTWTATPQTTVSGSGSTQYNARTGACVSWMTGLVVGRRRLRGRTFIVPLMATGYDTDGTLGATTLNTLQNAANALAATVGHTINIYHRPVGGVGGVGSHIVSGRVQDKSAVLVTRAR